MAPPMTAAPQDPRLETLYRDCVDLARYIAHARREVAAMRPQELRTEKLPRAGQELDTIVKETEQATHAIMSATEAIMALDGADAAAYRAAVEGECMRIFEACSFQDITGQRIRKVVGTLSHIEERLERLQRVWGPDLADAGAAAEAAPEGEAALLNGPQLQGQGIDQSAVDALFD
jgi:chemotaxis protein CheZ